MERRSRRGRLAIGPLRITHSMARRLRHAIVPLQQRNLMPLARQVVGGGHADHPTAQNADSHDVLIAARASARVLPKAGKPDRALRR